MHIFDLDCLPVKPYEFAQYCASGWLDRSRDPAIEASESSHYKSQYHELMAAICNYEQHQIEFEENSTHDNAQRCAGALRNLEQTIKVTCEPFYLYIID